MREWKTEFLTPIPPAAETQTGGGVRSFPGISKNARLEREELAELIGLSLEFKCWDTRPS